MQSRDRPPPEMAASELFEKWLPDAFAAAGRRVPAGTPIVRVSVSGAGGGAWELGVEGERLIVEAPGREPPDLWIRLSAADLRVALGAPDPDLPELLPAGWSIGELWRIEPADLDLLRQISGRLLLEIEGRRRRRFAVDLGFGKAGVSAGRPRTTLWVAAATFEALRAGTIPPMQPLLDGRLKIEGDRALAMQLMLLAGSRLGRR